MVEKFAQSVMKYRWLIIILSILLVLGAAKGMQRLTLTTDYRVFFSEDNPQLLAFDELQNTYTKNDNIMIAIAPKDKKVFTRETLAAVETLTEQSWQIPYSIRVDSLSNYQHTRGVDDDLLVADLYSDANGMMDRELESVKQIALHEPLLLKRLVSEKGDVTAINVTIQVPGIDQKKEIPEAVNFTRDMVSKFAEANPHFDIYLTGTVMMNNAFPEAAKADMKSLVPIMFLVVMACIWFMLRSLAGVFTTLLVVIFSIATALGITGWLGITLTPPSGSAPTIILTLAVADCIHVLVAYIHGLQQGEDKRSAMADSIRINFQPVTLTSMTTMIGFLSMNFSDAPPFRDLGNMVAIGIVAAWILSLTLFPALTSILPIRVKQGHDRMTKKMSALAEFVINNRRLLLWGNVILVVALAASITKNELNDQFVEYFDESIEFRRATDFVTDNLTGIYTIDYSLKSGEAGGINEPAFLAKVDEFADWYRAQDGVIHVSTFTDIMKRLNMNLHGDDKSYYKLPEDRELAAQYLLLYEMSLPYGLDLNNQIDIDKSATRMNVTVENLTTNELLTLEQRGHDWLRDNAPASMAKEGSSPAVMFAHLGMRNLMSMLSGSFLALVLISFVLIAAFRSVRIGLISLMPNLLPAIAAFGIWGLLVGEVGVSLSIVMSMTLGIVVDDTIHFLSKYLRARREKNLSTVDAIRYAYSTVGTALWVTSIVLMVGFSVLALSSFKMNAGMGLLTAITIGLALMLDFLFLAPLILMTKESKDEDNINNTVT